jgi:hypothetical protein
LKVAANDVERILMAAQSASAADSRETMPDELSFADRVAAFQMAARLSATPLFWKRVRGAKSGKYRRVLVLRQTKSEGKATYVQCLVPYTDIELAGRRVVRLLPRRIMNLKYKPTADKRQPEAPWPCHFHTQFIREDRLEAIP